MGQVTEQQILEALKAVVEPERKQDIVSLGIISGLVVKDGHDAHAFMEKMVSDPEIKKVILVH